MGGIVISCDSGVIKYQKEVWREGEGGVAKGGDREMGKRRTGMNEVSVYMDACVRVWGKGRRGSRLLHFTYLACILDFTTMCICIIPIVNLPPE